MAVELVSVEVAPVLTDAEFLRALADGEGLMLTTEEQVRLRSIATLLEAVGT